MHEVKDQPSDRALRKSPGFITGDQREPLKIALVKANSPQTTMPNEQPNGESSPYVEKHDQAGVSPRNDTRIRGDLNSVRQMGRGNRGNIDGGGNGVWQDSSSDKPSRLMFALVVAVIVVLLSRFPHLIGLA
ncbi:hypothetical protein GGR51DRAFT_555271 [Nemania sp. FL0031]|nr:hypothetical protein GGR51DRAFT_555271 [Nemania sp. FL0031]